MKKVHVRYYIENVSFISNNSNIYIRGCGGGGVSIFLSFVAV